MYERARSNEQLGRDKQRGRIRAGLDEQRRRKRRDNRRRKLRAEMQMGQDEQPRKESGERIILCDNGVKPDEGKCDEIAESNKNPYPLISDT